jgi:deoxyribodipyrimidine photo-lyase
MAAGISVSAKRHVRMIQAERVRALNRKASGGGRFVLYWMQASPRASQNHALEYAVDQANRRDLPLIAFFGIDESYPESNQRHVLFMLEGLRETAADLLERGVPLHVRRVRPPAGILDLADDAALIVTDRGYLRIHREWRDEVAGDAPCPVLQVESNVVVPVETASEKEEWSAATFRKKIRPHLARFLVPLEGRRLKKRSQAVEDEPFFRDAPDLIAASLRIDQSVRPADLYRGGPIEAKRHLNLFINNRLGRYPSERNDPTASVLSNMSPYLHFGQISPLEIALQVRAAGGLPADAYLEELIIRRELAVNFVFYNPAYDRYDGLPAWAKETLEDHAGDYREQVYSSNDLEFSRTGDPYWNAAQTELRVTGKMHAYMRMYWGKKILLWIDDAAEAYAVALSLNNRYELDGRDPNGYAGVAWCFGKHDHPWPERQIFGKVRSMTAGGLRRKFDPDAYVARVNAEAQEH